MQYKLKTIHAFLLISSVFIIGSCSEIQYIKDLIIEDAYVNSSLEGKNITAGYLTITNNSPSTIVIKEISCEDAKDTFFHEVKRNSETGLIKMKDILEIKISGKEQFSFYPNGNHIMLTGLVKPLKKGEEISCIISSKIKIDYPLKFKVR